MTSETGNFPTSVGSALSGIHAAFKNGQLHEDTPEIAAIFQQIKGLREAERSLRSLRRNIELDNVPSMDPIGEDVEGAEVEVKAPNNDLTKLLDSYLALRDEKDAMESKFNDVMGMVEQLQQTVAEQAKLIESLKK